MKISEVITEALTSKDPVEKWIAVFKKSSHPKFAGKTPEQRERQARMAHYRAVQNKNTFKEAGGPDMSRRGFLRGAGAAAATAVTGLPKIQADALSKILSSVGADFLEQMVHRANRGSLRFFLNNEEYNKVTRMGDVFPDKWFEQHKKNPVAAYRNLTGEIPSFAKVLDVLRSSGLEPAEFLRSEPVQRVAKEVQAKWQAKWRASGASSDPFKSPGEPPRMDNPEKTVQLEPKQLAKPKYKGLADPDEEEELAIGRASVTEQEKQMRISEFAPNEKPERDDNQPQFMAWEDFIAAVANLVKSRYDVKMGFKNKKLDKTQAVVKFIPHDPYETGPVMLYAFKDRRPPYRIGIRAHMQVGTYSKHNDQVLTQYQTPKNNLKAVDMTPANATMVAHAIMQNKAGALKDEL